MDESRLFKIIAYVNFACRMESLKSDQKMGYKVSNINKIPPVEPTCRKTIYNSQSEAEDIIRYIRENRVVKEIHAYKCMTCGFWHLTSKIH
jgi:hypothetical protein